MAHKWEWVPQNEHPFERWRRCTNCGAEQERIADRSWNRVTGYSWYPKAGRCNMAKPNPSLTDADYWIAEWLGESNHRASAHTKRAYTADVRAFLSWLPCPFTKATAAQILDWHSTLTGADASKARRLMAVRSFYTFLNAREITNIRVERLRGPKRSHEINDDKVLTETEVNAILDAAKADRATWLFVRFLYQTGARIGEVLGDGALDKKPARWRDFTPMEGGASWLIRGKGRKKRAVFVPNPLWSDLCASAGGASDNAPIFPKWDHQAVRHIIRKLAKAAGIARPVSPHCFRHSNISHMLANGANLAAVRDHAGHSSLEVTSRYAHADKAASPVGALRIK